MGEGAKAGRQGARGTTGDCRPAVQRPLQPVSPEGGHSVAWPEARVPAGQGSPGSRRRDLGAPGHVSPLPAHLLAGLGIADSRAEAKRKWGGVSVEGRAGGGKPADRPAIRGHLLSGCSALPRPASERAAGRGGPGLRGARTRPRLRGREPPRKPEPRAPGPLGPALALRPHERAQGGLREEPGAGSQSHI